MVDKDFLDSSSNLLDWVESAVEGQIGKRLDARAGAQPGGGADAYLFGMDRGEQKAGPSVDLGSGAEGAQVEVSARRISIRFGADQIAQVGATLEEGGSDPLACRQLADGDHWVVNYADPNATKALHVGHLRNLAIGQGVAGLAEGCGATVLRQTRVCDFGRNMGEAMAGYLLYADDQIPADTGEKSDHFVGRHYAHYVQKNEAVIAAEKGSEDANTALSRERHVRDDLAERLLARWSAGRPDAVELFERLRDWVMEGQEETHARLGFAMDKTMFESEYLDAGDLVVAEGLASGLIVKAASGATLFPTGDEEFPNLLITRTDGFPTQHLRYIATWRAIGPELDGARTVGVWGSEWGPLAKYNRMLLAGLDPDRRPNPETAIIHGMVTLGSEVISSSTGVAFLIDTLLDEIEAAPEVVALCDEHERCQAAVVARTVAIGFFLAIPPGKKLSFSLAQMLDNQINVGWALARAWATAWDPAYDGIPDPQVEDPDYRFLVVRSQAYRRLVLRSLYEVEPTYLARYLLHLSRWFCTVEPSPATARAMRTVLAEGSAALGFACGQPEYAGE
jgi:arginyl-tRNA synthetase